MQLISSIVQLTSSIVQLTSSIMQLTSSIMQLTSSIMQLTSTGYTTEGLSVAIEKYVSMHALKVNTGSDSDRHWIELARKEKSSFHRATDSFINWVNGTVVPTGEWQANYED